MDTLRKWFIGLLCWIIVLLLLAYIMGCATIKGAFEDVSYLTKTAADNISVEEVE